MKKKVKKVEVVTPKKVKSYWTASEKRSIVLETYQANESVSEIARKYDIPPSKVFYWRKCMEEGALVSVGSSDNVVPKSHVKDLEKRISRLERMLGKKTEEVEILKEAVKIGREKKLISRKPLEGVDNFR